MELMVISEALRLLQSDIYWYLALELCSHAGGVHLSLPSILLHSST